MPIDEINAFIASSTKSLVGDVEWTPAMGVNGGFKFRRAIQYSGNRNIQVQIWCNTYRPKMSIAYFVPGIDRIYGFCLRVRHNGLLDHRHHGHKEIEKVTPLPDSIAMLVDNPAAVWEKFCAETSLTHTGTFSNPTGELWLPQSTEI